MEERASRTIPRQTALVKRDGYTGWREHLNAVGADIRAQFPTEGLASTSELQLLVDGVHTVLDIKKMLDAQMQNPSPLPTIFNYLEILKAAGLVEM